MFLLYILISPFVSNAPFFYPLKTSENLGDTERVYWEQVDQNQTYLNYFGKFPNVAFVMVVERVVLFQVKILTL